MRDFETATREGLGGEGLTMIFSGPAGLTMVPIERACHERLIDHIASCPTCRATLTSLDLCPDGAELQRASFVSVARAVERAGVEWVGHSRAKELLSRLVRERGRPDDAEMQHLREIDCALTPTDVEEVLSSYLRGRPDNIFAAGILSEEELAKVRAVVRDLNIPRLLLSPELLAIVDGQPLPR